MNTPNIFYTHPVKKIAYYRKSMRIARAAMALSETRANYQYMRDFLIELSVNWLDGHWTKETNDQTWDQYAKLVHWAFTNYPN